MYPTRFLARSIGKIIDETLHESNRIKFGLFLALQLIALICFIVNFLQYSFRRDLRKSLSYDIIFFLLLSSFFFVTIALTLSQVYLYQSLVWPSTDAFCSFWNWLHYSLNIINLFLMAFASVERYLFIFHFHLFRSREYRILFHYSPILFCVLYPPLFYFGAIYLCPCRNTYDYRQLLCTWPCYFGNKTWTNVDLFLNNYTPLLIIPIFCSTIYLRVFCQRHSMQLHTIKWRQDKRLIVQLLAISSLYLIMWMPIQITGLINLYWDPSFLLQAQIDYMYLFPYTIHVIYPMLILLINLHQRPSSLFICCHQMRKRARLIEPIVLERIQ